MNQSSYKGKVLRKGERGTVEGIKNIMWLLIAFILGVTVGLYWGGMTVKQQFQEMQTMKEQFVMESLSE
jgi:hypothetical protein